MGNIHANSNQAGTFNFARGATGLVGVNSGSPIASFLLGAVDNGNSTFRAVDSLVSASARVDLPRRRHVANEQQAHARLRRSLGLLLALVGKIRPLLVLRSDRRQSGRGRPSGTTRLRRRRLWRGQLRRTVSRRGVVRRIRPAPRRRLLAQREDGDPQRVGHLLHAGVLSRLGRRYFAGRVLEHAQLLEHARRHPAGVLPRSGLSAELQPSARHQRPTIATGRASSTGRSMPTSARTRISGTSRSIASSVHNLALSVAYVGSAGRRLPSSIDPINAIDPRFLSMGDRLNDQFTPGMTSLNGVPLPYAGWVEQMTGCAPSVAQALRPYPQYCDNLQGLNEGHGESHYNSLQVKLEKRFSGSTYALVAVHAVEDHLERVGQHAARGGDLEWPARRDLAVRARSQRGDCGDRHAARAVGGVRVPVAVRRGEEIREPGRRRQTRWLAAGS